jgi:hypothetical protein
MEYTDLYLILVSIWQAAYYIVEKDKLVIRNMGVIWLVFYLVRIYMESQGG